MVRGTQGFSSSSKLIDEKKVSLIASTHGGVEALATGSADSSANTRLIMNLNAEIKFLTARDTYDVLLHSLHFVFAPIVAKAASQRWLSAEERYGAKCWAGCIYFVRALVA